MTSPADTLARSAMGRLSPADPTPVEALRFLLERRALAAMMPVTAAHLVVPAASGDLVLSEVKAFREIDPDLLRELVINLLAALHSKGVEAALWISGDGERLRFFLGQYQAAGAAAGESAFVRTSAEGFLKGAETASVSATTAAALLGRLQASSHGAVVCGIPSEREGTQIQTRLDEALEALARRQFDVLVRFTPVSAAPAADASVALDPLEDDLASIVNAARAFASLQQTREASDAFTDAFQRSRTATREARYTATTLESHATRHTKPTTGNAIASTVGTVLGALVGLAAGPAAPIVAPVTAGIAGKLGSQFAGQGQRTDETSRREEDSISRARGEQDRREEHRQRLDRDSVTMTLAQIARQAERLEQVAEVHLERVQQGRALGAFLATVAVATEDPAAVDLVAHTLVGALRGDRSFLEPMRVIRTADAAGTRALLEAMTAAEPPRWTVRYPGLGAQAGSLSTLLTAEEAALWLRPPCHPIAGVSVKPNTRFHRNTPPVSTDEGFRVGRLLVDGRKGPPLFIRHEDLKRHCFIAGVTGSGKTTTVRTLLRRLLEGSRPIPFLLVEPAKSEYRELFDELVACHPTRPPLRLVAGTPRNANERKLAFNPFRPVAGIPIGRYVDQLRVLLQSCFAMQESLPQLLEALVVESYRVCGLDLAREMPPDHRGFHPTFRSMLKPQAGYPPLLDSVIARLGYGREAMATLRAALRVRLESFSQGAKAEMFAGREQLDWSDLLTRPVFVELSDISDPLVRRFILGSLVLRLAGEREAHARATGERSSPLRHVLVLEEAHHFLREPNGTAPGAELVRHSNELLADALAELRSYGQGIVVADQSPAELAPSVLRNTLVKIAHGLAYEQDCAAMGDAMGIDPRNRVELRRLGVGECFVSAPRFDGPVHALVDER